MKRPCVTYNPQNIHIDARKARFALWEAEIQPREGFKLVQVIGGGYPPHLNGLASRDQTGAT